jgi:hypothetical protein
MSINIGLDIGAVSLKLAAIGSTADDLLFHSLSEKSKTFYGTTFPASSPFAGRPLVLSSYRRIQGSPIQSTFDLLQELYEHLPEENVEGIRVTGSGSQLIAKILGIYFENEFRAIAKGVRVFNPEVRTIFEIGGESSKYLRLDPEATGKHLGIVDYQTSGECAAGTGSFIDQQATRLRYTIEEVGPAVCGASCAARIAGRCSVFAKTDMIHAQQKGYSTEQILRGLCDAVARNFKSSLVKGRAVVTWRSMRASRTPCVRRSSWPRPTSWSPASMRGWGRWAQPCWRLKNGASGRSSASINWGNMRPPRRVLPARKPSP